MKFSKVFLLFIFLFPLSILSQVTEYWGYATQGGIDNYGTIFKTDENGQNLQVVHDFVQFKAINPHHSAVTLADNGLYYGVTSNGLDGSGRLFSLKHANSEYEEIFTFNQSLKGLEPVGTPIQANNGLLYGLTFRGGPTDKGVLYSYNLLTGVYSSVFFFDGANTGSYPKGSLIQMSNNKLYGMTSAGGSSNQGVIFEFDIVSSNLTVLHHFSNPIEGNYPISSFFALNDSMLFGMTEVGGNSDLGTIFKFDINSIVYTKIHDFNGVSSGKYPQADLTLGPNGNLYGTTLEGGSNNVGVLFSINPNTHAFVKHVDFGGAIGAKPYCNLILSPSNLFYGTASLGGSENKGTVFSFDPNLNTISTTYHFDATWGATPKQPMGSLALIQNDTLIGMSNTGGCGDNAIAGSIFSIALSNSTLQYDFSFAGDHGSEPVGEMTKANNGKIYGVASGGPSGGGVLFEINPQNNQYRMIEHFEQYYIADGYISGPSSYLIEDNGYLYGVSSKGGDFNNGTLYRYNYTNDSIEILQSFSGNIANPGNIIQGMDGNLYGTSAQGDGALFKYDMTQDTLGVLFVFTDALTYGKSPVRKMMQASNGRLYGTTLNGGANNGGTIYEYNLLSGVCMKKFDFSYALNGTYSSELIEISGLLYATCHNSGLPDTEGIIYSFDPIPEVFTIVHQVNVLNNGMESPASGLVEGTNGIYYGLHRENGYGGPFKFNPQSGIPTYTHHMTALEGLITGLSGFGTYQGNLLVANICYSTYASETATVCDSLLSPSGNYYWSTTGLYSDTIANSCGGDSLIIFNVSILDNLVTNSGGYLSANTPNCNYQWIDCDNGNTPILGASNQIYQPTVNGNYAVIVSLGGCSETSDCIAVTDVSVEEIVAIDVKIYPNPTHGELIIESPLVGKFNITNIQGQILRIGTLTNVSTIDVDLESGLYILNCNLSDGTTIQKIIILE